MLTVSGRSSPFLSVGESLYDIVYVYKTNLSQHSALQVRVVPVAVMPGHPAPRGSREAGSGDRTGVAIQDPD